MPVTLTRPWTPEMKERAIRNAKWVKENMQSIVAMGMVPQETFGEKIKKAVKARLAARSGTRKEQAKQTETARDRHRHLQRRPRTKGE